MASEVSICSQALARVGQGPITNIDDQDRLARVCKLHYADKRDALLRNYRWKFAIKRASDLAALSPAPTYGYSYRYAVPNDCLRVLAVNDLDPEFDEEMDPTLWDREGDAIVTDEAPTISLRYIARITDPTRFDPMFADALSIYLATYLVPSFREVSADLPASLREEFEYIVRQARHISAIEGRPRRRYHTRSAWLYGYGV